MIKDEKKIEAELSGLLGEDVPVEKEEALISEYVPSEKRKEIAEALISLLEEDIPDDDEFNKRLQSIALLVPDAPDKGKEELKARNEQVIAANDEVLRGLGPGARHADAVKALSGDTVGKKYKHLLDAVKR